MQLKNKILKKYLPNIGITIFITLSFSCSKHEEVINNNHISSCCDVMPPRYSLDKPDFAYDMVWIPAGEFTMGAEVADFMREWPYGARSRSDERPLRRIKLDGFWMSITPVTNKDFSEFVEATGYVTTAEKPADIDEIMKGLPPGTKPPPLEALAPASMVFTSPDYPVKLNNVLSWWRWQKDANWRQPEGPGSSIENRMDHPVVQVSFYDVQAYAKWRGLELPTEAQWEYAARGGHHQRMFTWGDTPINPDNPEINIWQGSFPNNNSLEDGYEGTSPVTAFAPNDYGLYDMSGNVWEWVADWYHDRAYSIHMSDEPIVNPIGPSTSYDPDEPYLPKRVIRGGSFLCNDSYCSGYRPGARMKTSPDTSANHTGFRLVKNVSP